MTSEYKSVIEKIQPVVLVGGQSSRFGRDKLIESVHGELLVSRPINALRAVFGNRVAIVGECDQQVMEASQIFRLMIRTQGSGQPVVSVRLSNQRSSISLYVLAIWWPSIFKQFKHS